MILLAEGAGLIVGNTFATAINCMDGRIQIPVIEFIQNEYTVEYVDMVTEPGPNRLLADNADRAFIESIKARVTISVNMHKSKLIAIVGHHDCAGNRADKEKQLHHIRTSIDIVKSWGFEVQVVGLWVDDNWQVTKVE